MMVTYEYKLYSNKKNKHLDEAIDLAAEIWNHCIAVHKMYYKLYGKSLSANKLKLHITKLKHLPKYQHWSNLGSQAIQDVVERIERSYKAFFEQQKAHRSGRKSPPHFRKHNKYYSFTLKQAGYSFEDNVVTIMGVKYRFFKHRDFEGAIKTVTVKRDGNGSYYIFVVCRQEDRTIIPRMGNSIGFDFGLKHFLTDSEGNTYDCPEFYKQQLVDIRRASKNLSSKKKGSNNRKRAKRELAALQKKAANQRKDWFYKLAYQIVENNTTLCFEDLSLTGMQKLWGRKINDYAFAEFLKILQDVCNKTGCELVKVDRWLPSTKTCSICGTINSNITLAERTWECAVCHTHHDRDTNAAINILHAGLTA